jgi:membrane-associated PAP2 superfamily phosphatase
MLVRDEALRWRRDAVAAQIGAAVLLIWELSGIDIVVTRWFGSADGFPWRDNWWTSTLLHQGGRIAAGVVLAFLVLDSLQPIVRGPSRIERRISLLSTLACLLLIPALKQVSTTSCPWDLAEFGGTADYVPHWAFHVTDGGPGHCFPSGHVVAAFAFLSVYFMLRPSRPAAARMCLVVACLAGVVLGGAQVMRGAHHPSHVMWAAWLCWLVCVAMHRRRCTTRESST